MSGGLERLASACLFPGFEGLSAPDWLRRELEGGLGGVVLFSRNLADRAQLAELSAAIRAERAEALIGIDEEGGDVTRLEARTGSSYPGNLALGAVDDVELTERVAAAIGGELAACGVNHDLAPVADVNSDERNPIIGVRSFGSEPELVARHTAAFVAGLQRMGVAACAKHFPGHGATHADSHLELPTIEVDRETLLRRELVPFRAAIQAGVQSIMTAHIRVPSIDELPATLSREHLTGLLREELGFDGMVITDALEMRAVSATVGVEDGAVLAIAAGADALCLGHDLFEDDVRAIRQALVEAVHTRRLPEERLAEAAASVERAGRWTLERPAATAPQPAVGLEAARRALRVEGSVELTRPALVVELVPEATIAAGPAGHTFGEILAARRPGTEHLVIHHPTELPRGNRQLVVVIRDTHRHEWEREVAQSLAEGAIVVDVGVPVWRPQGAGGYMVTYGAGRANLVAAAERLSP
ncbi:MAG: beta-N-acetylhexosaminidase [Gaiellaceae bacterium]